jgi:hypothetical protein
MLALAVHRDIPHQHELVMALIEGTLEHRVRVDEQTGEHLLISPRDPSRGLAQPFPVRVLPAGNE